jgi:hypothetical protein
MLLALLVSAPATAQEPTSGLLPEPPLLTRAIDLFPAADAMRPTDGWYPELGHMVTGAGWIAGGPGYRHRILDGRALVEASTAISWRTYKMAQARLEFPALAADQLTVGIQALWQDLTQVRYFGAGPRTTAAAETDYRLQTTNAVAYASVRPRPAVAVTGRAGYLARPDLSSSTGFFDRDLPDAAAVFASEPAASLDRQPAFLHADAAVLRDTRNARGHPTGGGLYRAAWGTFNGRGSARFTFHRYELEAAHFLPALRGRHVLAARGWAVFTVPHAGNEIPFYLLPSLGGSNTLRGYPVYRFHDRDLLVVNLESRWAVLTHVDAAVFGDAGSVAPEAAGLGLQHRSYGAGLRLHNGPTTIARFDAARSSEGWRFLLRLNDPLRLQRLSRRTAPIPMVP